MPNRTFSSRVYLGTFATGLFIQGCTVLQGVLLARLLGPAGRGEFATVILWPSLFAALGLLGVDMAIARFAGEQRRQDGLARLAVGSALLTGTATAILCGLLLPYLLPADKGHLLFACYMFLLFIPLNHLGLNLQGIDHGKGNFLWFNATRALLYPIYFAGLVLCWLYAEDKVLWAIVALLVANGGVVLLRVLGRLRELFAGGDRPSARYVLRSSLPFVSASVIALFYAQTDKALLVWLLPPEEIGLYVAAFAAAGSINVLNSSLGVVQFSSASQAQHGYGFPALACILRRGAMVTVMGAAALAMLLPYLLPVVFGADFAEATPIALILLPGMVLAGLSEVANQSLRGQGQPMAGVLSKSLGLVVMGGLGVLLASRWGGRGIAVGYLAGEVVCCLGLVMVSMRYYRDADCMDLVPRAIDFELLVTRVIQQRGLPKRDL